MPAASSFENVVINFVVGGGEKTKELRNIPTASLVEGVLEIAEEAKKVRESDVPVVRILRRRRG